MFILQDWCIREYNACILFYSFVNFLCVNDPSFPKWCGLITLRTGFRLEGRGLFLLVGLFLFLFKEYGYGLFLKQYGYGLFNICEFSFHLPIGLINFVWSSVYLFYRYLKIKNLLFSIDFFSLLFKKNLDKTIQYMSYWSYKRLMLNQSVLYDVILYCTC